MNNCNEAVFTNQVYEVDTPKKTKITIGGASTTILYAQKQMNENNEQAERQLQSGWLWVQADSLVAAKPPAAQAFS